MEWKLINTELANFFTILMIVLGVAMLWYILRHRNDKPTRSYFTGFAWRIIIVGFSTLPVTQLTGIVPYGWLAIPFGVIIHLFCRFTISK